MAIFLYTIGIGILNGAYLVDFDRRRVLGHVHGGTLGWLTLGVFAASLWLFGGPGPSARERTVVRVLVAAAIVSFACYVAAFSLTYGNWRPIVGVFALGAIAGFFAWVAWRVPRTTLGVPHSGFLAALGTSIVGGLIGVLLGLEIATGDNYLPDGGEDAHPATMVVGFLIPVALALIEWSFAFPAPPKATRSGIIQMVFPFLGGVTLMTALLWDITPLAPIAVLLEVIGVGIFLYRLWPNFRRVDFLAATAGRHGVASAIAVVWVIGLAQFWIIKHEGDFDLVPTHQILALDHSQFIGAMTNAFFAILLASTLGGRRGGIADHAVFIAVNAGIIGFAAGLLFDITVLKRIFAPIMGAGLLLGLGLYAYRLLELGETSRLTGPRRAEPALSGPD
jgi:hypothetical protein